MKDDLGDDWLEDAVFEVTGTQQIAETDEDGEFTGDTISLDDAYDAALGAYLVASENF